MNFFMERSRERRWLVPLLSSLLVLSLMTAAYEAGRIGDLNRLLQQSKTSVQLVSAQGNERVQRERGLFAELAKKLTPTVVHIEVQSKVSRIGPVDPSELFPFWNQPPTRRGEGSGVIIDANGYILTNNHVVSGADEIKVILHDRTELKGRVVGTDPSTDLALIKVDPKGKLPVAELGDSDAIEVGDWVMAIGNPFGLEATVTVGVLSGKGRVIGAGPYDQFLQTDASINPGNSGGPLFDTEGKVVGINTAIVPGGQGIGFAIPINLAKSIVAQLRDKGQVERGFIGVRIQALTPELARALELPSDVKGALVAEVVPGSPAARAGVQEQDVIVAFDGKPVQNERELLNLVAAARVGSKATLEVYRQGRRVTLQIEVTRRPSEQQLSQREAPPAPAEEAGVTVRPLTPELARRLGTRDLNGVVITEVRPGSPAAEAGLEPGDIVRRVGGRPITSANDFYKALEEAGKGKDLALLIEREGDRRFLVLEAR
jgi:serine protease Do